MRDPITKRLEELKKEFDIGQGRLREAEAQQTALRETLLRISGAVQVLEELLKETNAQDAREDRPAIARQTSHG